MRAAAAPRRRILPRARVALRAAWTGCGLLLAALLAAELLARVTLALLPGRDPYKAVVAARREAEGGAPWLDDYDRDERALRALGWEPREFVRYGLPPYEGRAITVLADRARKTWNAPGSQKDPLVLVLGGSTAWGWGARDERTIPSALSRLLRERGLRARVVNAAVPGYFSTQELFQLQLRLQAGERPAVVAFVDGLNEVLTPVYNGGRTGETILPVTQAERLDRRLQARPLRRAAVQAWRATALRRLSARLSGREEAPWPPSLDGPFDAVAETAARLYAANALAAEGLGARFGFETLHFWQPVIATKKTLSAHEQNALAVEPALRGTDRPLFLETGARVRRALAGDPRFRDLGALFDDEAGTVYSDNEHYTEAAGERVARAMLPDLERALRRRR